MLLALGRMLDSKRGEYSYIFNYQLEMTRRNPGTTCVVTLHPDYVCNAKLDRGFMFVMLN
jgi:hypothetical protein